MKVALEADEVLEVAVLDGDKVIGTLSLQLKGLTSASSARRGRPPAIAKEEATPRKRRQRKPMSAETRARMAAAQKARWEKRNAEQAQSNTESSGGANE